MKIGIDFSSDDEDDEYQNVQGYKYQIKLDYYYVDDNVTLLFPFHPTKEGQTLKTKGYRNSAKLNKEINKRLEVSKNSKVFCIDDFQFVNITKGNLYLVWARSIVKTNVNGVEVAEYKNSPVLIWMDGFGNYMSPPFFIFADKLKVKKSDITRLHTSGNLPMFCLESDRETQVKLPTLRVVHDSQSEQLMEQLNDNDNSDYDEYLSDDEI